jgi:hypothetical protein
MPIRAEFRHLYRRQWLTVIRPRVLKRAHNECERCRKPQHAWILEEPRSTILRAMASPHDLDPRGCQGLAIRRGTRARRSTLRACPAQPPLLVHLVPPPSRPAPPQGNPLPPEGRRPAHSARCSVSGTKRRRARGCPHLGSGVSLSSIWWKSKVCIYNVFKCVSIGMRRIG